MFVNGIHTRILHIFLFDSQKNEGMAKKEGEFIQAYIHFITKKHAYLSLSDKAHHSGTLPLFFTGFIFKNSVDLQTF